MKDNTLKEIRRLVKKYPNDMQLGKQIRQMVWKRSDKWRIEQFNRNRSVEDQVSTIEELERRIDEISNS